jgi:hypothetical protein
MTSSVMLMELHNMDLLPLFHYGNGFRLPGTDTPGAEYNQHTTRTPPIHTLETSGSPHDQRVSRAMTEAYYHITPECGPYGVLGPGGPGTSVIMANNARDTVGTVTPLPSDITLVSVQCIANLFWDATTAIRYIVTALQRLDTGANLSDVLCCATRSVIVHRRIPPSVGHLVHTVTNNRDARCEDDGGAATLFGANKWPECAPPNANGQRTAPRITGHSVTPAALSATWSGGDDRDDTTMACFAAYWVTETTAASIVEMCAPALRSRPVWIQMLLLMPPKHHHHHHPRSIDSVCPGSTNTKKCVRCKRVWTFSMNGGVCFVVVCWLFVVSVGRRGRPSPVTVTSGGGHPTIRCSR